MIEVDGIRPKKDFLEGGVGGLNQDLKGVRRAPQQAIQREPRALGEFIAGYKALVSSRAKGELNMTGIWQRNYYDHIVRDDIEINKFWLNMKRNPQKWEDDLLHPSAKPNKFNLRDF